MLRPRHRLSEAGRNIRRGVILRSGGRCQMCGRTAERHGVALTADKCPWGQRPEKASYGLWAVCLECSLGLRAYFRSLKIRPETLRKITSYGSVHVRIGELLRAFGRGRPAPFSLIESVAGQVSWKTRLRELRQPPFNFEIASVRQRDPRGRVQFGYALLKEGNLTEIKGTRKMLLR